MASPAQAPSRSLPRKLPKLTELRSDTMRASSWLKHLLWQSRVQSVIAAAAYLGCAIYLTWPLVTDLDSTIYGAVGDLTGAISTYRELVESGQLPFASGTLSDFNAPDGLDIRWTLNIATFPEVTLMYSLSKLFGPIAAAGLYTLLAFTLSGLAMFLLVRRLTGHPGVAVVAGYAYAFYPFVVVKAQGHIGFVHGWVLVVPAWRLIELMEKPSLRNGVLAGLALVLAFAWTPYHILFAAVIALALGAAAVWFAWRRGLVRAAVKALAVAAGIAALWLGGMALLNRAAPRSEVRSHTIEEAIAYSARAEEYVVPTGEHPLFGKQAGEFRASHLHGSNRAENTLYVGVSVLLLALLGLIAFGRTPGPRRRMAVAAAAVAVAGFAFSSPPEVDLLGITFPTTTRALFELTTSWRAFSRLVVVVMLGLVLLAAFGMVALTRRRRAPIQAAILLVLFVVVAADLWAARPARGTNEILVPATYNRLASLPDGITVEYPLLPAEQSSYGDVFYQGWHDKPIVNGYPEKSPEENRALRLRRLDDPATVRGLAALGVRYVLALRDPEAAQLPSPGRPGRGFRLLTRDPYISLYGVTVRRPQALVSPMDGFAPTEGEGRRRFQWLTERQGTIEVRGSCSRCVGTVQMTVTSFAQPRTVTVRDLAGRVLADVRVREAKRLRLPVDFERSFALEIETRPGPQSIARTTGALDQRSVSVSVSKESFRFAAKRPR